jgi:UDP-N-acetylmuramoyl-tripeptide--D-alanyl-D-alanine ligase
MNFLKNTPLTGFTTDSRKVNKGSLFFALKGEKTDGHLFLKEAASLGAAAAVVHKDYAGEDYGLTLFRVEDVLKHMQELAAESFKRHRARVIAVTGSVGKTTTKEFIAHLLKERYRVDKTPGNSNSQVGVPLSLLNAPGTEEVFVLEMGMTGGGQISKLVHIAPPEVAILTSIALAHVGLFTNGLEGIAEAKAEIFSHPQTKKAFVHCDAWDFTSVRSKAPSSTVLYGKREAFYQIFSHHGQLWIQEGVEKSPFFTLPFYESHLLENFLAAVGVARYFGLSWEEIFRQAQSLTPYKQRFEKIEKEGVIYINDCYNANPTSMKVALLNLPKGTQKTIAVLGKMVDLGVFSEKYHREIAEIALQKVDHLFCLGEECIPMLEVFQKAGKQVDFFTEIELLKKQLKIAVSKGDIVLLKGSNVNALWKILE